MGRDAHTDTDPDRTPLLRLVVSRSRAEEVIDRHLLEGRALQAEGDQIVTEEQYEEWNNRRKRWGALAREGLRSIYSNDEPAEEFAAALAAPLALGAAGLAQEFEWAKEDLSSSINTLDSLRERLEYLAAPEEGSAAGGEGAAVPTGAERIFIVHGRDGEAKETVSRLLEKTGAHEVVILHEQPSEGRTLIEKFEDYARASDHAVVLLTADDVGGVAPQSGDEPELQPRGRQNVVFELGFFVGRLGRSRVTVLYDEGVELPSDFKGVVYISRADGSWRYLLLQELRSAGLNFDLNKLPT